LTEEYIQRRFAFSHDDFIKVGKDRLPPEVFYDANQKVGLIELNADFILAGFIDGAAEIYYTDSGGTARAASYFAVVGEGEYVAASALLRREQDDWKSLENTLYNVFEAKRLAESIGSIGRRTYLNVISSDGRSRLTSFAMDEVLEKLFKKYGPQNIPRVSKFDSVYYFDEEEKINEEAKQSE
jgi:hypothetical protein